MYDNISESSEINVDEIDKILENMEDLDNALLRGTLKSKESKKEAIAPIVEPKKKVGFQDFNDDDSFGDILSEEDTSKETSKPIVASIENKKVADLFGIRSEESPVLIQKSNFNLAPQNKENIKSGITPKESHLELSSTLTNISEPEKGVKKVTQTSKSIFNDEDDSIVLNLTDKPKPANDQTKKSTLMEDLFSGLSNKTSAIEISSHKNSELLRTQTKAESNPPNLNTLTQKSTNSISTNLNPIKTESVSQSQAITRVGYSPTTTVSAPRESRRGKRPSGITDPLGLLSTLQSEHTQRTEPDDIDSLLFPASSKKEETVPHTSINNELPEWLGGSKSLQDEKVEGISVPNVNPKQSNEPVVSTSIGAESTEQIGLNGEYGIVLPPHASLMLRTQFDQHAALVSMQQQENVLRTAATLSQQNKQFSKVLENQKFRLDDQERQFNMLLKKQIERQASLEAQMKLQQDRIDCYLQTLIAQPSAVPSIFSGPKTANKIANDHVDENIEAENLVQKLKLEKLYSENTLDSLKEKHEKEIIILDSSYKKQMLILEATIDKLEQKMQSNLENLEADYEAKLHKLKEEMAEMEKIHKEEKEELKKEHILNIQQIYDRHSQNIILLQNEHAEVIQNISKAKTLEEEAIKRFSNHKENIDDILRKTEVVINSLQNLEQKIEERNDTFHESKAAYVQTQAEHLKSMREQLEKQNTNSQIEHKQLLIAAQKLEESAVKLAFDTQKRNIQYNEIEDRLKMKEQAQVKERELFLEQVKWERNYFETMKETWCREQERRLELLAKEREDFIAEKGKLEISNRLKSGTDDMAKAQLEAMIKSAQDMAANAFQEKRKWQQRLDEVEMQKNVLDEKENQLLIKAKELESLTQSALVKREEGLRALKEARRIEEESKERMNQLQTQFEIIAQREDRIAAEKLSLARERLSLRISQVEKPEKDVSAMESQKKYLNDEVCLPEIHSNILKTHFTDIVDPQLILLKLDLDNKLDAKSQNFDNI